MTNLHQREAVDIPLEHLADHFERFTLVSGRQAAERLRAALAKQTSEEPTEDAMGSVRASIYRVMDERPFIRLGQDTVDDLARAVILAMRSQQSGNSHE